MKLIHQGFDSFYVTFQGIFPEHIRRQLEIAKKQAQDENKEVLIFLGDKKIPVHVFESGLSGGFAFRFSTGPDRENWAIADNNKSQKWNIRVQVTSLSLMLYGYEIAKNNILEFLKQIEAQGILENFGLLERISRFDYCFDFESDDFAINPKCIVAHSRMKRHFIGGEELISRNKNIEYVRIGNMPGRSIVFYNKRKEVILKRKEEYWGIWGIEKEGFNKEIWRVEIRAGKDELNSFNLRTFEDFEKKAGDVLLNIANSIRYVKLNNQDKNVARWKNKEFWDDLLNALKKDLFKYSSNAKRGEIITTLRNKKIEEYLNLITSLIPPYMAITERGINEISAVFNELKDIMESEYIISPYILEDKIQKARERFIFLD
jgi:hypothetical protein